MSGDGLALLAQRLQALQEDGVKVNPATANPGELLGRGRSGDDCRRRARMLVLPCLPCLPAAFVSFVAASCERQQHARGTQGHAFSCGGRPAVASATARPLSHPWPPPSLPSPQRPWACLALR